MKHKLPIIMIAFLLVALFIGMGGINSIPLITSANANEQRTVIIDAGHAELPNTID